MPAVIKSIVSIGHQDSFQKHDLWETIQPLAEHSQVIAPDYKAYISPASLRRFSPVLRMALTAAQVCQNETEIPFDAVSVGTALGCLKDTERFLQTFITATGDTLSPTAFIQSTHNTIAGAISMALGNHSYNMTHTQNSLSFETALIDGLLCIREGKQNVLVGAADEAIEFLDLLKPEVVRSGLPFTSGATFLSIQPEKPGSGRRIVDCMVHFNNEHTEASITAFLEKNNIDGSAIELVLFSGEIPSFTGVKQIDYEQYTGLYYSSAAFACHLANDYALPEGKYALIVNHQVKGKLGLTLVG